MNYAEYKNVIDFLNLEFITIIVNLETEYEKIKNLDLIISADNAFKSLDKFIENIDYGLVNSYIIFWLDPNIFELKSYLILEDGDDLGNYSFMHEGTNNPKRQLVLDYSSFIKLIS